STEVVRRELESVEELYTPRSRDFRVARRRAPRGDSLRARMRFGSQFQGTPGYPCDLLRTLARKLLRWGGARVSAPSPLASTVEAEKSKTMTIKTFARSLLILVAAFVGTPGFAQTNPNQGPGGPILVITNGNQNFGKFYAEILRTEGFNEFTVAEIGSVTATTLNSYDLVILAKMSVTTTQASMFSTWVTAGGNLIAMDPAPELATLLGITPTANTLSNGYLLVNTATRAGAGSVDETIQFHGTARMSGLNGASSLATLYSDAVSTTGFPAVTLRNVGASGGQAAGFMFDLATSVVYTRQGNPAWAGQERDGNAPLRSDDMFFGASASDPAPNWVDMNKVDIPQADEQQRLLANLIIDMNADRKPLPRFWYFPHD